MPETELPLRWWWENQERIDQLARYLIGRKILITAEDYLEFHDKPHGFNRFYEQMMSDENARVSVPYRDTEDLFDWRFYDIQVGEKVFRFKSITTITSCYPSPELTRMIGEVGGAEMELRKRIKAERGSRVHDALQKNTLLRRANFDDEEWLSLMHAKMFQDRHPQKLILNEQRCWSVEKEYAGRFDRIVLMLKTNLIHLIDWKTGFVGREAWLQLAAEKYAIEQTYNISIPRWGIVSLNAKVTEGWKYYEISERADVVAACAAYGGDEKALERAIEEAYLRDVHIFDCLHEVWRDLFSGVRAKRFPIFPVPKEMDLSIEVLADRDEFAPIEEEIVGGELTPFTPPDPERIQVDAPTPPPTPEEATEDELELDLKTRDDYETVWKVIQKRQSEITLKQMQKYAIIYRNRVQSSKKGTPDAASRKEE